MVAVSTAIDEVPVSIHILLSLGGVPAAQVEEREGSHGKLFEGCKGQRLAVVR